jgi:hypothetical protein
MKEFPCNNLGACRRLDCFHGHACQKKACQNGKVSSCKFQHENHKTDAYVAEWVRPGKDKSVSEEHSYIEEKTTESMDTWGTRVGILIDI